MPSSLRVAAHLQRTQAANGAGQCPAKACVLDGNRLQACDRVQTRRQTSASKVGAA